MRQGMTVLLLAAALFFLPTQAMAAPDVALSDAELIMVVPDAIVQPPADLPELPEPAALVMMLLGLCVIGSRLRDGDDDTFH